jgi:hypothetical protein
VIWITATVRRPVAAWRFFAPSAITLRSGNPKPIRSAFHVAVALPPRTDKRRICFSAPASRVVTTRVPKSR